MIEFARLALYASLLTIIHLLAGFGDARILLERVDLVSHPRITQTLACEQIGDPVR
jgi:hypothetical protein